LLSKYDIDLGEELGRGGVGIVYRAKERTCGQDLVVKTIIQDSSEEREDFVSLLKKEIKDTPQGNPFVSGWQKIGKTPEEVIFAYRPYIEGRALGDLNEEHIEKGKLLPVDFSVFLVHLAALILNKSHEKGVSHRDLCPFNILVNAAGYPSLLDWGWPGVREGQLFGGKPGYVAPELVSAPQSLRPEGFCKADVFSLGVVLYEMISGFNPFNPPEGYDGKSFDYRLEELYNPEKIPSLDAVCQDATREISEITSACLRENPQERITVGALYDYLLKYLYTRIEGVGVTSPAIASYINFFSGKEPSFKLNSIAFGHLRRPAEDKQFASFGDKNKTLKDYAEEIANEKGFNLSDPKNASRNFLHAFGEDKVKEVVLSLYTGLSTEERQAISGYNTCELTDFLEKQDPDTNEEIHREIARRALGRYVSQ